MDYKILTILIGILFILAGLILILFLSIGLITLSPAGRTFFFINVGSDLLIGFPLFFYFELYGKFNNSDAN